MKNIDNLFEEGLGGYTEAPPPAAWGALEKKLDAVHSTRGLFTYRRIWLIALIGLFLIAVPGIKYISTTSFESTSETTSSQSAFTGIASNTSASDTRLQPGGAATDPSIAIEDNSNHTISNTENKKTGTEIKDDIIKQRNSSTGTKYPTPEGTHPIANNQRNNKIAATPVKYYSHRNPINEAITTTQQIERERDETITTKANQSNPGPVDEQQEASADNSTEQLAAKPEEITPKENNAQQIAQKEQQSNTSKKAKAKFNKWEAGLKAGYECGFDNDAAKKIVVSPYIQFNLSPKFAVLLQPSIKGGEIANRRIGKVSSYYSANSDSAVVITTPTYPVATGEHGTAEIYKTDYRYTQSYDSIAKSYSIGGYYFEADIPLLLKYNVTKSFSVYAGATVAYGSKVTITENTYTKKNIAVKPVDKYVITRSGEEPVPPPVNSVVSFSGTPYSDYQGPAYTNASPASWRAGYMTGFSYQFSKRLMFDALVQQTNAKTINQSGYNVNKSLSAPYIRITLGYKLLK